MPPPSSSFRDCIFPYLFSFCLPTPPPICWHSFDAFLSYSNLFGAAIDDGGIADETVDDADDDDSIALRYLFLEKKCFSVVVEGVAAATLLPPQDVVGSA